MNCRRQRITVFLCLASMFAGVEVWAEERRKIAIMPLKAQRVKTEIVQILDTLVVAHVGRVAKHDVIGADEISAFLDMEGMKDKLGCTDVACAAEIGGALDAEYTLAGSVSKLGKSVIINLTLFENKTVRVFKRGLPNSREILSKGCYITVVPNDDRQ